MEMMYLMVYLLMGFSALLVVIVLYNSGNLSFNERVREFATLKVLGYRSERIRRLTLQNCWLSLIGILIGAPFGRVLLQYMLDSNRNSYDYIAVIRTRVIS
ncbi:MAG: ABC transporter permease [Bacteroidaceae bacterium]